MNFFGHAAIGIEHDEHPAFVFGTMLPDFAGMVRARLDSAPWPDDADSRRMAEGVALHHLTDDVFHGAPDFVALCHGAVQTLEARGLERGRARAMAHIATELMLDGLLVNDEALRASYTAALETGVDALPRVRFARAGEEVTTLVRRIASYGPPLGYRDDDFVLARLAGALAGRPRLRLSPNDEAIVGTWLAPHRLEVTGRAAALLEHVRSELYRTPPDVG